jgi:hypothetical protein
MMGWLRSYPPPGASITPALVHANALLHTISIVVIDVEFSMKNYDLILHNCN